MPRPRPAKHRDHTVDRARVLRRRSTPAEQKLWSRLRDRRLLGDKFRRQYPVDRYILDFFCIEAMLAIEVDGGGHGCPVQSAHDQERTEVLASLGIRVLRFWNDEIFLEMGSVLERIASALRDSPSP